MSLTDQAPRVLLAMAYKLIAAAQIRWRAVNVPHLIALVRAGLVFDKGKLLEQPIDITPTPSTRPSPTNADEVGAKITHRQVLTISRREGRIDLQSEFAKSRDV